MVDNRAVAYVRVSSLEQSMEGVSLDAQETRIKAYATMRGLELVAVFREEAVSAGKPLKDRPQGALLLAELAKKKASHVIAVKLDRLFRNATDALATSEAWEKSKRSLHILDMGGSAIDTSSAMGKMFFLVAAGFAAMERNLTAERTKAALGHMKRQGRAYTRIVPFGFDRSGDALVENAAEMATVKRIQALRSSGLSLVKIANILTVEGIATKQGGQWRQATIDSILKVHATIDK